VRDPPPRGLESFDLWGAGCTCDPKKPSTVREAHDWTLDWRAARLPALRPRPGRRYTLAMACTLFVGDVHLEPGRPEAWRPFLDLLERECEALYLLGDTFDYWVTPEQIRSGEYGEILEAIRRRAARSKVYFLRGNRDYLVERKFARAAGVELRGDRVRIDLGGRRVLAAHGDFLFNRNPKYAAYRAMMRSRPVNDLWRQIPGGVGKALARGLKALSPRTTRRVEWTHAELVRCTRPLFEEGVDVIICGHIHQPQHLQVEAGGRRGDLFVLGDWCGGTRDYVEFDGTGFRLTRKEGVPSAGA